MRQSGPWTYGIVNLVHLLGVATLFGSILVLDLRLVGLWRAARLATIAGVVTPVAQVGFGVAALSGVALLSSNATEYLDNPFFAIKFPAIALGLANVWVLGRLSGWRARGQREPSSLERRQLAAAGAVSLGCWLTAVSAGRMIGYW